MWPTNPLDLLAFNVKLLGTSTKKNVLVSAGNIHDKERLLPAIKQLIDMDLMVYATPGTARFLAERGITVSEIHKIADRTEPNILTFLKANRLDLVINVLTGDQDYDETSDVNLIRRLAIEGGTPLLTDVEVALRTVDQIATDRERGTYDYRLADKSEPWNMRALFAQEVAARGGFTCHHAHFDKAYLISADNLRLSQVDMQKKWELYKYLKENYSRADLIERISRGVETMIAQGVKYCRTMVDADSTVKLLPIESALEVQRIYRDQIKLEIGVQPLQGVLDKESRIQFEAACERADFVGGLPSKDRPTPERHLDVIMEIAKKLDKPIDVHVDQENNPNENETELLAEKTIEHGLEGKVHGVHAISVSAKSEREQDRILERVKQADLGIIVCPSAALSMKQLGDMRAPLHNSIAPVGKLIDYDIRTYLGVDNIHDLFMPIVDGDIWFECRMMMEATRIYDLEKIATIATATYGSTVSSPQELAASK